MKDLRTDDSIPLEFDRRRGRRRRRCWWVEDEEEASASSDPRPDLDLNIYAGIYSRLRRSTSFNRRKDSLSTYVE